MTPSEISALMREATDKINEQRAWIKEALPWLNESKISLMELFMVYVDTEHRKVLSAGISKLDALIAKAPE